MLLLSLTFLWLSSHQPPVKTSVPQDTQAADISKSTAESYEKEKSGHPKQLIKPGTIRGTKRKSRPTK